MKNIKIIILILSSFSLSIFAQENVSNDEEVYLNFEDASLTNVVTYLAEKKKINLIPHQGLNNQKVTLTTHTPFDLKKAWDVLLTLLENSGYTIINVDDVYRVVPKGEKSKHPLPLFVGTDSEKLPDSDLTIRYVYLFRNINAENVKPILDGMLAQGSVQYNNNLNICTMTEKSLNIKVAMKIVAELDGGGLRESIQIIDLKHAEAETIAKMFSDEIFGGEGELPKPGQRLFVPKPKERAAYFSSDTKIIPDTIRNRLILLGTLDNLQRIKRFIAKHIDVPIVSLQSRMHIKELKYTLAEDIKPILDDVIQPPVKDFKFNYFEDMKVAAEISTEVDEAKVGMMGAGNRLVIACNKDDWTRIEKFIDKLDKPQPQVALEILFVDVSTNDSRELATQLRNKAGMLGNHVNAQTQHILNNPNDFSANPEVNLRQDLVTTAISPNFNTVDASYFTLGKDTDVHAVLRTILTKNNSNIISQPYMVVNNHEKCNLNVAEDRLVDGKASGDSTSPVLDSEHVQAKTAVEITPGINSKGVVSLKIHIAIDAFTESESSNADRTNRSIDTMSTMMDGEVLVIGGLTRTRIGDTLNSTPVLSKVPVLGHLFKGKNKSTIKTDLYIFIRPTLIKPRFEGKPGDYTQLKLDYARLSMKRHDSLLRTGDPIQRWFFGEKLATKENGNNIERSPEQQQVEDFVVGKRQPKSVVIPIDTYYKSETSRTIKRLKTEHKKRQAKVKKRTRRKPLK